MTDSSAFKSGKEDGGSTAGERYPDVLKAAWDAVNVLGAPDTACTTEAERAYCRAIDDALDAIDRVRREAVTPEFIDRSAKAAIRALRGLEQTAIMLEAWAQECFPEINENGQKHFARVMMESAAEEIRNAWANAIAEVSPAASSDPGMKHNQEVNSND